MILTLILGAPVQTSDRQIGKLQRIIIDNGIANQVTVNPGLLGLERVVPISIFEEATADGIRMEVTDEEWKAYSAFKVHQDLSSPVDDQPNLSALTPSASAVAQGPDASHPTSMTGARGTNTTVSETSVVLSTHTVVVNDDAPQAERTLKGLVIDTGRPQQLVLDDDSTVAFTAVSRLDEQRIHIGGAHEEPILDADRGYERTTLNDPSGDQRR
jgi:hypothetical protein